MRLGLHLVHSDTSVTEARLPELLREGAQAAEAHGFDVLSVMDHLMPFPYLGADDGLMPEAYTALAYLAACTSRVELQVLVSGVTYRPPGLLAKIVTTLDALSQQRARLGIGAAWFEAEHAAYGIDFPSSRERLDLLADTLAFLRQCQRQDAAFEGSRLRTTRSVLSPSLRADLPIMVGGSGERRTLRLVAQYADACNLFANPDLGPASVRHKLQVLRGHCEDLGRAPDAVQATVLWTGPIDQDLPGAVEELADAGVAEVHLMPSTGTPARFIDEHRALWRQLSSIPSGSLGC